MFAPPGQHQTDDTHDTGEPVRCLHDRDPEACVTCRYDAIERAREDDPCDEGCSCCVGCYQLTGRSICEDDCPFPNEQGHVERDEFYEPRHQTVEGR